MNILYLLIGLLFGVPLGAALLLISSVRSLYPKKPPTKEEWKVM